MKIEHLSFSFGEKQLFNDFSMTIEQGETVALMGPSGCGKTTLLRLISGLEKMQEGNINAPEKIAYAFQEARLFPWLTVGENIKCVGLTDDHEIDSLLSMFELSDCKEKYPDQLSGGMQARVNFIRALSYHPQLLLLDEPFAGWDDGLKNRLIPAIKEYCMYRHISVLAVLHSHEEALSLCDKMIDLSANKS